jgi:hypothetical protein
MDGDAKKNSVSKEFNAAITLDATLVWGASVGSSPRQGGAQCFEPANEGKPFSNRS